MARLADGSLRWPRINDVDAQREPLLPYKSRVRDHVAYPYQYPNKMTPASVEDAIRARVAQGMDFFAAYRQVMAGVIRWGRHG
jgi:hypothetical protein